MKSELRHYTPGEILYREGEDSDAAFFIETGRVALLKATPNGDVLLDTLGTGELFGETGILDQGARNVTARAETEVTARVVLRDAFLRAMERDPQTALKIMSRLAKRQRLIDDRLARSGLVPAAKPLATGTALVPAGDYLVPAVPLAKPSPPPRLFRRFPVVARLLTLLRIKTPAAPAVLRPKHVVVSPLSLEAEYDQRPYVIEALRELKGITAKASRTNAARRDDGETATTPLKALQTARQILADEKADLLVWGGEDESGRSITLWFAAPTISPPDRFSGLPPDQPLSLPSDFDESWRPLIAACVLTALGGTSPELPPLIDKLGTPDQAFPPSSLSPQEQARNAAAFGYCAAAAAVCSNRPELLETAVAAWRGAIAAVPRHEDADWTRLHAALGAALQMQGEKTHGEEQLRAAADAFRTALEGLRSKDNPKDWGQLQSRLGAVLFQIDMTSGDESALRDSLSAYKAAASVVSRASDPWRWAELMHGIAQTLQVWGDHSKNPEALRKAVELCQSALEIRSPEKTPALFAATRNNMGSALFLLAKHSGDVGTMRLAAVAFRDALAVHRSSGAGGPLYKIIEKNLSRAEELLRNHDRKPVASLSWAQETAPETISIDAEAEALASTL